MSRRVFRRETILHFFGRLSGRAKVQFLSRGLILWPCLPGQVRRPHAWGPCSQADAATVGWGRNHTYKCTRRGTPVDTVLWSGPRGTAPYNRAVVRRGDPANSSFPLPPGGRARLGLFSAALGSSPATLALAKLHLPGRGSRDRRWPHSRRRHRFLFFPDSILINFQELKQIYFLSFSELFGPRWEPRAWQVGR